MQLKIGPWSIVVIHVTSVGLSSLAVVGVSKLLASRAVAAYPSMGEMSRFQRFLVHFLREIYGA